MDLLNDIKEILKDNTEHRLKIEVDEGGVTVYLDFDPFKEYQNDMVTPVHYDTLDRFCYIPKDKFSETYKANDYGITAVEIDLVQKIMAYLEEHADEIDEICYGYSIEGRVNKAEKD